MQDARDHTLALFDALAEDGFPHREGMETDFDPPLWLLGRIGWFAEWYVLRDSVSSVPTAAQRTGLLTKGDDWFDTNFLTRRQRWKLELPSYGALKTYCHEVLDRVQDKLSRTRDDAGKLYPYRLALAHEDMCGETLACLLQALGVTPPPALRQQAIPNWAQGEIRFPGGTVELGSTDEGQFVFDNEKWAHPCYVPAFTMDSTLVTNAQY
ncbi:ergothioneine biosynthesis protein EgtB, partial [Oxalobacteraceae bacterium OM1]